MADKIIINTADDLNFFRGEFLDNNEKAVIPLATPVLNINEWYKVRPDYYALLLDITNEEIEKIAYYANGVIKGSAKDFSDGQIVTPEQRVEFEKLSTEEKNDAVIIDGAEAIRYLLLKVDLTERYKEARSEEISCMQKLEKLYNRYDEMEAEDIIADIRQMQMNAEPDEEGNIEIDLNEEQQELLDLDDEINKYESKLGAARCMLSALKHVQGENLSNLILTEINVLPLELRGILKDVANKTPYVLDDLEMLYRRVINRNSRVGKLQALGAPDIIMRNEKRMLQEYVDTLIANGRRGRPFLGKREDERCPMTSISDIILRGVKVY